MVTKGFFQFESIINVIVFLIHLRMLLGLDWRHALIGKWVGGPQKISVWRMKWNESCFGPPVCTYTLNWARRTSWGWWDEWMTLPHARLRLRNRWCTALSRACYLSVTEAPHNIESLRVSGGRDISSLPNLKARIGFELAISDFPSRQL